MSLQIQQQIKQNAAELRSYVEDLYEWEKQMEVKEKQKQGKNSGESNVPPIRGKAEIEVSGSVNLKDEKPNPQQKKPEEKIQELIRDQNTIKDYYKAWDKFDVVSRNEYNIISVNDKDKELEDTEQKHKHEEQSKYENPYEAMTSTKPRAAPRAQIKINSQRSAVIDINSLKDKANLYYQSLDFKKANELYTECIQLIATQKATTDDEKTLFANIYSNRAMTNIKLQEYSQAEMDGTCAIQIDPKHIKSYLRRGTARKKLKKFKESHEDFKVALQIQPDNKEAQRESMLIETALNERKQKAQQQLLQEGRGNDEYEKLDIPDISGSDIGDSENEEDDDDDEEDFQPVQNKFARLSVIDKKVTHSDSQETGNVPIEDRKRSVLFSDKPINLEKAQSSQYHKDEVPEHSILKNSHDIGHLVKNIDTKLIKHTEDDDNDQENDGSHTVKFKGVEISTQTFTPRHDLKPRGSILKNSPFSQEFINIHNDGKVQLKSRFKDDNDEDDNDDSDEDSQVDSRNRSKKSSSVSFKRSSVDKHIDSEQVEQMHSKYFKEKKNEQNEEESFNYTSLKSIEGKTPDHKRSQRHKPQFGNVDDIVHEDGGDDDDDDKKVHFGKVQNLNQATEVPKKEAKPRKSVLKSQEIKQIQKMQKEQKSEETKLEQAIESGKQKIKESIIESTKQDITSSKFLAEWENLKSDQPAQFKYLKQVDPHQLVHIFKEGIELPVMNDIFSVLNSQYAKCDGEHIKNYILQIPNLKRFKLSIGLLTANDKKVYFKLYLFNQQSDIKEIIEKLSNDNILNNSQNGTTKDLYKIK